MHGREFLATDLSICVEFEAFQKELERVGYVFQAVVFSVAKTLEMNEHLHRHALQRFFAGLREKAALQHQQLVREHPQYASHQFLELRFDCGQAKPQALSHAQVIVLCEEDQESSRNRGGLLEPFMNPPYGTQMTDSMARERFNQWCGHLGLRYSDRPDVLDWVGNFDIEPQRSEWSNYFDEGKDWWGIWCLTISNPVTRTIAVLAASTSD